jgi:hypothetical protein
VKFLTDFADQAVILPLVIAIAVALAVQGWWRGAAAWLAVIGTTFGAMVVLKIGFIACSPGHFIRTPSGHVAAATVVAGGLGMLLLRWRRSVLPLAALAGVVIGISRLVLGAHTFPEVVVGAVVGFFGAIGLLWATGPVPETVEAKYVGVIALFVIVGTYGLHMPAEAHIGRFAFHVREVICPDLTPYYDQHLERREAARLNLPRSYGF